jgi:hypothetical protein
MLLICMADQLSSLAQNRMWCVIIKRMHQHKPKADLLYKFRFLLICSNLPNWALSCEHETIQKFKIPDREQKISAWLGNDWQQIDIRVYTLQQISLELERPLLYLKNGATQLRYYSWYQIDNKHVICII